MQSNLEKLLTFAVRAYNLGVEDVGKQRTPENVFNEVGFNLRNGYNPVVWQSYKAGRFAKDQNDV